MKLKAISLFSGAGGDTLGMINSGIDVVAYVENNKEAIKTHNKNFKNCKLLGEDVADITDEDLQPYVGKIDIIFGGFPCQSFDDSGVYSESDSFVY